VTFAAVVMLLVAVAALACYVLGAPRDPRRSDGRAQAGVINKSAAFSRRRPSAA
jgi:hypothetical protein